MTARDKFRLGQRVQMSDAGLAHLRKTKRRTAKVVGFSTDGKCVWLILDGTVTRNSYHMDFWEALYDDAVVVVGPERSPSVNRRPRGGGFWWRGTYRRA